jgi:excisionase family DNA binding protein
MHIVETLENRTDALKVSELAKLLSVTPKHIYTTLAAGRIPGAFRVNRALRFDPQIVAEWLRKELSCR